MTQHATILIGDAVLTTPDLAELYRRHASAVRALLRRLLGPDLDPDDLLQDVFVIAWRKRRKLEAGKEFSFLCATAISVASNARRRAWRYRFFGLDAAADVPAREDAHADAEQRETTRLVYSILDRLSEKRRTAFILFELHGMTGPEIADQLGVPLKTVWTRLHHARRDFIDEAKKRAGPRPNSGEGGDRD